MTILCILLALSNSALIGILFYRERIHRALTADLLDRVMARSYGEYIANTRPNPLRPKHRRVLSDEEMADLEQSRLDAVGKS